MNGCSLLLLYFNDELGNRVVDDTGLDLLLAFCFKGTLVTVKLIAMIASVVLATWFEHKVIITWTCFVVNNDIRIFRFPD